MRKEYEQIVSEHDAMVRIASAIPHVGACHSDPIAVLRAEELFIKILALAHIRHADPAVIETLYVSHTSPPQKTSRGVKPPDCA